jgi:hypothetical protein
MPQNARLIDPTAVSRNAGSLAPPNGGGLSFGCGYVAEVPHGSKAGRARQLGAGGEPAAEDVCAPSAE